MAGFKCDNHFFCEVEPYAIKLYQLRFPDAINLGDITKADWEKLKRDYPGIWVITGGFPCQDISIAGKGAGLDGKRSGLWFRMHDAIRILRPKYVIAENVSAITFRGLDRVLSSLAEIGYNAEWQNIRASDMGLPHTRERLFIIAYPIGTGMESVDFQKPLCVDKEESCRRELARAINEAIPANDYARDRGNYDGVPEIMDRLKGLGNAIVPQIAKLLFELCEERFNSK